jgi:hypothetical protein
MATDEFSALSGVIDDDDVRMLRQAAASLQATLTEPSS